jgi:hypothetical protein
MPNALDLIADSELEFCLGSRANPYPKFGHSSPNCSDDAQ